MGVSRKGNKLRLTGKDAKKSGAGYATSVPAPTTIGVNPADVSLTKKASLAKESDSPSYGDKVEKIQAELAIGVQNLSKSENWLAYLESASKFHNYSFYNQMLIAIQNPEATRVASFRSWKADHERHVKAGEKALSILAPVHIKTKVKDKETGEEKEKMFLKGFRAVPVFDVSQTEGKELPEHPAQLLKGEAPEQMIVDIEGKIKDLGFRIEYKKNLGGANGYATKEDPHVAILESLSPAQKAKTLLHELAHIEMGHLERNDYHTGPGGCRGEMEVEAESTAHITLKVLSKEKYNAELDSSAYTYGYVLSWTGGKEEVLKKTGDIVSKAAKKLLTRFL